jgi:predicted transcriptional regulator
LKLAVRGKNKQYKRIMHILWHCYLSPQHCTQLEVAATLGVSDSLVSDYRSRIEQSLRALSFTIEEARRFETTLSVYVRALVTATNEERGAGYFAGGD